MVGIVLREVRSTKDKGLIGIAEGGMEIPLSAPEPGMFRYASLESEGPKETQRNRDAALAEVLKQYELIKLGGVIDWNIEKLQLFDSYTRRK